jgi:hypothetical protein
MAAHRSKQDIIGYTVRAADRVESVDSIDELNILEVNYTVTEGVGVKAVELVLTVGGPDVRVDALNGTIRGSWGGNTHKTHFENPTIEYHARELAGQFEGRIDR